MTFSQFFLYMETLAADRRRDLRDRAIAARAAQATQDDWKHFIDLVDSDSGVEDDGVLLERIEKATPKSTHSEDEIEWQK